MDEKIINCSEKPSVFLIFPKESISSTKTTTQILSDNNEIDGLVYTF